MHFPIVSVKSCTITSGIECLMHQSKVSQLSREHLSLVRVEHVADMGFCVLSESRFSEGDLILRLVGDEVPMSNRYSVFVAEENLHIDPTNECRFLNHSCRPNARFSGRDLFALHPIEKGEQICFDYRETELHLHEPFYCKCENDCCGGRIA